MEEVALFWLVTMPEPARFAMLTGHGDPIIARIGHHAHPGELYLDAQTLSVEEVDNDINVQSFFQEYFGGEIDDQAFIREVIY